MYGREGRGSHTSAIAYARKKNVLLRQVKEGGEEGIRTLSSAFLPTGKLSEAGTFSVKAPYPTAVEDRD